MALLRTILYILVFYYVFKFLAKLFAPFLMKKAVENIQKKTNQQQKGDQQSPVVKEGETVIDKAPRISKQSKDDVGEYVEFEEVE